MGMIHFVKAYCRNCESQECTKKPLGTWATEKEGCIKEVASLDGSKYFHYIAEVMPMNLPADSSLREEMNDFLYRIANLPAGERFYY